MQLKPLEWSEPKPPNREFCSYDHCVAESPFGQFRLEWKSWKGHPEGDGTDDGVTVHGPWPEEWIGCEYSLEDAKAAAQEALESRIRACLINPEAAADPTSRST